MSVVDELKAIAMDKRLAVANDPNAVVAQLKIALWDAISEIERLTPALARRPPSGGKQQRHKCS